MMTIWYLNGAYDILQYQLEYTVCFNIQWNTPCAKISSCLIRGDVTNGYKGPVQKTVKLMNVSLLSNTEIPLFVKGGWRQG